jgi:hypothetical protein
MTFVAPRLYAARLSWRVGSARRTPFVLILVSLAWALRADLRRKEGVLFSIFFAVLKGRSSTTTPRFLLDKQANKG